MSSSTFVGNPDVIVAGSPPPPPPPPPVSGQLPAMRINTVETATTKKPQMSSSDTYEPPAAIQNAMLTKDKKPFTYTPGMGGKLDLSQIRSPRMARRVAKNANDEGIEGPPKSVLESKPSLAASAAPNLFVQPQVAVPVFPTNISPQPQVSRPQPSSINRTPSNAVDKQAETSKNITKIDTKMVPITITSNQSGTPESPNTPTQVTLAKAPTPWLQNKNKPQEELPEWAKRASINKAASSLSESTIPSTSYAQIPQQTRQSPPQHSQSKQKMQDNQQSTQQNQLYPSSSPQYQYQQRPQSGQPSPQQRQIIEPVASQRINSQAQQHERVVPIRIENRPSVFDAKHEPGGHHQFKQPPTMHHQQRWGQVPTQYSSENQVQNHPQEQSQITHVATFSRPEQSGAYIIPIVVEGNDKKTMLSNTGNNLTGKAPNVVQQRASIPAQQHETGPVQSRSFRVLQKITDTDGSNDVGTEQIRKMELSEDERILMNKFKEQVDHETYLHQEEDPRYRGAAIPSRAFRFLQNMTDSTDASVTCAVPRNAQNATNKKQNRNSKSFEETQANLPPSEQQVPEPKKYMGSAIPSRSFRILQAMTAPESIATQENRQADYTYRTENNLPGNQQDIFLPPQSVPLWYPEGWWSYYPVQYNVIANEFTNEANRHSFSSYTYPGYLDGNVYVGYESYYPSYDQNFVDAARVKDTHRENSANQRGNNEANHHQLNHNGVCQSQINANNRNYIHNHSLIDSSHAPNDKHFLKINLVNDPDSTILPDEINHLDAQSNEMYNPKYLGEDGNNDKNGIITAMNIIDEEDSVPDSSKNTAASNNVKTLEKTFGLHINVPNYTYIDTSDSSISSDSSDSSDSASDNEHLLNSGRKKSSHNNDTTSNNTSSDSDSDFYVAYSTGLNPHEKSEKKRHASSATSSKNCIDVTVYSECSISTDNPINDIENSTYGEKICPKKDNDQNSCDTFDDDTIQDSMCAIIKNNEDDIKNQSDDFDLSSRKTSSSDCELDAKQHDQEGNPVRRSALDDNNHYQLNVVYKDTERSDSENLRHENKVNINGQNEAGFEAIDDPPDDSETTMVSVSLPLRFKFHVSENNEDVTTVIVGDSKMKAEKSCSKNEYLVEDDKVDDVRVNFHIGTDTSVDFTVKRHANSNDALENTENVENTIPHVNFTLRRDSAKINGTNYEEQMETEFTVTTRTGNHDRMDSVELALKDADDCIISESVMVTKDILAKDGNCDDVSACNNFKNVHRDKMETIVEPKITTPGCSSTQDDDLEAPQVWIIDTSNNNDQTDRQDSTTSRDKDDPCIDPEFYQTNQKCLLNVQDSREDTDDEDSGVTSDISRMISEADTDSECTSSKALKQYQRTQTHSRLFRLLNDDSILSDRSKTDPSSRKKYLSLPLKTNEFFNYDDYCSNSSGLTSPEYSPIREQSWRRFYDATSGENIANPPNIKVDHSTSQAEQVSCKDDPYFRTWKNPRSPNLREYEVVPSLAFKFLDSKMPSWAYKANVLCPRIKSTKSVPQTLLAQSPQISKINDTLRVSPIPTSCANAKTDYC